MDWYCNTCGNQLEIVDADTLYGEFDGIEEAYACEECGHWWFYGTDVIRRMRKGEEDCEAKMN